MYCSLQRRLQHPLQNTCNQSRARVVSRVRDSVGENECVCVCVCVRVCVYVCVCVCARILMFLSGTFSLFENDVFFTQVKFTNFVHPSVSTKDLSPSALAAPDHFTQDSPRIACYSLSVGDASTQVTQQRPMTDKSTKSPCSAHPVQNSLVDRMRCACCATYLSARPAVVPPLGEREPRVALHARRRVRVRHPARRDVPQLRDGHVHVG